MKIKLFKTDEERVQLEQWHKWFAWYPVAIEGAGEVVWLRTVERKMIFKIPVLSPVSGPPVQYRLVDK